MLLEKIIFKSQNAFIRVCKFYILFLLPMNALIADWIWRTRGYLYNGLKKKAYDHVN
jgi:hypothetical protein